MRYGTIRVMSIIYQPELRFGGFLTDPLTLLPSTTRTSAVDTIPTKSNYFSALPSRKEKEGKKEKK